MIETIGKRLAAARYHSARAGMLAEQLIQRANGPLAEVLATQIAHESGKAAGNAFRAAELAYDLGHDHGRRARSVAHMWADIANTEGGFTPDVGVFTAPEPGFYRLGSGDTKHMVAGESVRLSQRAATHISAEIQKAGIVSGSVDDFNRKMREARDRFDESVARLRLLMNSGSKP